MRDCEVSPIVTMEQNFDSLLVAKDHVTRSKKTTTSTIYYYTSCAYFCSPARFHSDGLQSVSGHRRCQRDRFKSLPHFSLNGGSDIVLKELFKSNGSGDSELALFETDPSLREEMSAEK